MKKAVRYVYFKLRWLCVVMRLGFPRLLGRRIVFILGTPLHTNIGDLAITKAEISFIRRWTNLSYIAVDVPTFNSNRRAVRRLITDRDIIACHGGGNLGDTYPEEEDIRRFIIRTFRNIPVFIFPQTIYFSDTADGRKFKNQSVRLYAKHPNLTIITREKTSYNIAKSAFAANNSILTPDIVLSSIPPKGARKREGVLLCLRDDVEKTLSQSDHQDIWEFAQGFSSKVTKTDTVFKGHFFALRLKNRIVTNKWRQFSRAELVITDRLHGMVFAAITGTPCIVFSNFNYKVRGTYEWIAALGYIAYCGSVEDMKRVDIGVMRAEAMDYNPAQFDVYWQKIIKLMNNNIANT